MAYSERSFNIGSFNLFNLLKAEVPFYGRPGYSSATYDKKVRWVANQLDQMEPDIIGFQEIFHQPALEDVLSHSDYLRDSHFLVAAETGDLPRVGIASRFPILDHEVITDFPQPLEVGEAEIPIRSFSRPLLRCRVKVRKDVVLHVYVVHLKSKRPDIPRGVDRHHPLEIARGQARSLIRRAAEACALRQLLLEDLHHRDEAVVVMGDVNDSGLAVTSRIVSGDPPHRNYPVEVKKKIWDVLLYHVKDIQARRSYNDFYFSHIHNGHYEALDHIMVSQELVAENPRHIGRVGNVRSFNDHLVDETMSDEDVPSWQSDHGQVVATIELRRNRGRD